MTALQKLRELIKARIAGWTLHLNDHGPGAVLQHRLQARIDEAEAILIELTALEEEDKC